MLRIAIAIALAGVAAAESTLDVDANGSLRVTRQLSTTLSGKPHTAPAPTPTQGPNATAGNTNS